MATVVTMTDEELVSAYRAGASLRTLAAMAGVSHPRYVRQRLVAAGEPVRSSGRRLARGREVTSLDLAAMAAEYRNGATLDDLSARYEVDRETVRTWLIDAGVEMRSRGSRPGTVYRRKKLPPRTTGPLPADEVARLRRLVGVA
jgi:hypothetical protein